MEKNTLVDHERLMCSKYVSQNRIENEAIDKDGIKCYSILYVIRGTLNSTKIYVVSNLTNCSLTEFAILKKQGIDKFVAFGVRLVHSWQEYRQSYNYWRGEINNSRLHRHSK